MYNNLKQLINREYSLSEIRKINWIFTKETKLNEIFVLARNDV